MSSSVAVRHQIGCATAPYSGKNVFTGVAHPVATRHQIALVGWSILRAWSVRSERTTDRRSIDADLTEIRQPPIA